MNDHHAIHVRQEAAGAESGSAPTGPMKRRALFLEADGSAETEAAFEEYLECAFTYHAPTPEQVEAYAEINRAAKAFARAILHHCPPCADRTDAIRLVRVGQMTANAAIATRGQA